MKTQYIKKIVMLHVGQKCIKGKIFANEPNLLRVVAWGFWIPMGHYYQQMWIKCFSWVFLTFRWFWVCWTDAIFCRGQTHLTFILIKIYLKCFQKIFSGDICVHASLSSALYPTTKPRIISLLLDLFCFPALRETTCLRESIFSNTIFTLILTKIVRK